ncbi:MAG: hypothetical protein ACFFDN_43570 [Candidatus Hodarchaeota archaeon]
MEKIEAILEQDEEILWKNIKVKNLYYEYIAYYLITLIPVILPIYWLFLIDEILIKIIISLLLLSVAIIYLYAIYKIPSEKRKFIERYQLNPEEYKKYQEIYTITNKRWIQKNYSYIKESASQDYYLKKFIEIPSCKVQQKGDILFATLDSFQIIKTWNSKRIAFFISDDYYFLNSTDFIAKISSKQDFQELIKIIRLLRGI